MRYRLAAQNKALGIPFHLLRWSPSCRKSSQRKSGRTSFPPWIPTRRFGLMSNAWKRSRSERAAMKESLLRGFANRILQHLARVLPGAQTLRVALHRARGVKIGKNVWIGYDVILDTSRPFLITLEDGCVLSMRVTVVAHFRGSTGVKIERDA